MRSLLQAGARVQAQLAARGWRFCFIGGIANFRWGTPRLTNDLDLTVLAGFGGEGPFIAALAEDFAPRIADAADFATRHRVVLLQTVDGFAVDVALGAMPSRRARSTVRRRRNWPRGRCSGPAPRRIWSCTRRRGPATGLGRCRGCAPAPAGRLGVAAPWADLTELAALKEEPELVDELERVARRAEAVIGTFPRPR